MEMNQLPGVGALWELVPFGQLAPPLPLAGRGQLLNSLKLIFFSNVPTGTHMFHGPIQIPGVTYFFYNCNLDLS